MNWIDRAYTGQERLWRVFWPGVGILLALAVAVQIAPWVAFVALAYMAGFAIATWRCAPNAGHRAFTLLGRVWAVVLGLMVAGTLFQIIQ